MVRIPGATIMMQNIRKTQVDFVSMSAEDRLKFIERYEYLQPYQKTALLQCRKFMSPAEKRAYKQVRDAASQKQEKGGNQPPEMGDV